MLPGRFRMRTLRGESYCLPSACRDAPLGQRQGGVFRLPPPYLWAPPTPQCNNCDRRQRRKQGAVVGAAASKTRVPPKARSGCWVPQPVAKGCSPLTILKKKSKHKKASAAPVGASALTLFSLLHLKPLSRCATAPPRGANAPGSFAVKPQTFPPCQRLPPRGSWQNRQVLTEGVHPDVPLYALSMIPTKNRRKNWMVILKGIQHKTVKL